MTTIMKRSPLAELTDPRSWLSPFFADIDSTLTGLEQRVWSPAIDVVKQNGNLVIRADVPGMKPEEIDIEIEDDVLTLSGEHTEEKEEREGQYMRRERRSGSFRRSIGLPASVDPEQIEAVCKDGVLEVTVPVPSAQERGPVKITPKASD